MVGIIVIARVVTNRAPFVFMQDLHAAAALRVASSQPQLGTAWFVKCEGAWVLDPRLDGMM